MDSTLDIYTSFFGLKSRPFALVPDPDFIYWSDAHERAFARLEYGLVNRAPISLLTGEVGAGKTTLVQQLVRSVKDDLRIALLSQVTNARGELLRWIMSALGQQVAREETQLELFERFQKLLVEEHAAGRRILVIVDEAQTLTRDDLEELRMLSNINKGKDELVQVALIGQPELRERVRQPDLTQFAQRVSSAFHIPAMSGAAVRDYIAHRLEVAGGNREIFTRAAMDRAFKETGGVPRLVNQLCDLAMVYAYSKDSPEVTGKIIQEIIQDGAFFGGAPVEARAAQNRPDGSEKMAD